LGVMTFYVEPPIHNLQSFMQALFGMDYL
jgi:hypothetical protein